MNNPSLLDQYPWLLLCLMLGKENCESLTWKWDFHNSTSIYGLYNSTVIIMYYYIPQES